MSLSLNLLLQIMDINKLKSWHPMSVISTDSPDLNLIEYIYSSIFFPEPFMCRTSFLLSLVMALNIEIG